jgi:hypothetical protein
MTFPRGSVEIVASPRKIVFPDKYRSFHAIPVTPSEKVESAEGKKLPCNVSCPVVPGTSGVYVRLDVPDTPFMSLNSTDPMGPLKVMPLAGPVGPVGPIPPPPSSLPILHNIPLGVYLKVAGIYTE